MRRKDREVQSLDEIFDMRLFTLELDNDIKGIKQRDA